MITWFEMEDKLTESVKAEYYYYFYYEIIENTAKLCHELNIKDQFSVFIIFNYLLWNGYFSEDKNYFFSKEKTIYQSIYFAMSIMTNYGVCLNNSHMLCDLFKKLEYKSAIVEGYLSNNLKLNYNLNIKAKSADEKNNIIPNIKETFFDFLTKKSNHACVLNLEDNNPYIFDSTNNCIFYLKNTKAPILSGRGYFKPTNDSTTPWYIKEKLEKNTTVASNINIGNFFKENVDLCNKNLNLLDDFYDENYESIKLISKYVKSLKK